MKKELDELAGLKEQLRSMIDTARGEKRKLTDTEKETFEKLNTQKELLEMKIARRSLENNPSGVTIDKRALFTNAVCDIVNHRSLEEYGDTVSENGIKITERAEVVTDTGVVTNLIPVTIGEIIEPLEKGLIIDKLGIKMQSGLHGELTFPTLAAIEASIMGETAAVGDTKLDIGKITATPKRVSISVPVSKRAINQSNFSLHAVVLKQLSLGVARLLNKWMFADSTLAGASDGVFVKATPNVEYENSLSFADVVALETAVMDEGVDVTDGTAAYVCTPTVYGQLKSTPIEKGSPKMILENGMVNGYPVLVTNYMAPGSIGFGVFSYSAIGQFGDMDLIIDPYTDAKKNIVNFVINSDYDIVVARNEAFAIAKKKSA